MNKYYARKTEIDGIVFDSKHEAERYCELKLMARAGEIRELMLQYPFELIPAQKDEKGRMIERPVCYIADFVYFDRDGNLVVEDAKGMKTEVYKLKRKMMLYFKGIKIREV